MAQRTEPIQEPFHLTASDPGNTAADGTANTWSDIWKFQVPRGTHIVLSRGNTFACFLEDDSPAEIGDLDSKIRIVIRDPGESSDRLVFGPALYKHSKEFQDKDLMARLRIPEAVHVPSRYWIVIQGYDGAVIDASDSDYDLYCHRIRVGVGAHV